MALFLVVHGIYAVIILVAAPSLSSIIQLHLPIPFSSKPCVVIYCATSSLASCKYHFAVLSQSVRVHHDLFDISYPLVIPFVYLIIVNVVVSPTTILSLPPPPPKYLSLDEKRDYLSMIVYICFSRSYLEPQRHPHF